MTRSLALLVLLSLAAACAPGQPTATLPPTERVLVAPPEPPIVMPSDPTPAEDGPIDVPRFAQLDVDLAAELPLRAKVRRAGPLYLTHDGTAAAPGDGRAVLLPVTALDSDDGAPTGSPRRPRLLCEGLGERVAVYMDAADLATVALTGAVLLPSEAPPESVDETTPGVHLAAGEEVALTPTFVEAGSTVTVTSAMASYRGLFVRAEGFLAYDHIDVVYVEDPTPAAAPAPDGELVGNVWLTDRPGGKQIIQIAKGADVANRLLVRVLRRQRGSVLIRYDEIGGFAVGWVAGKAVRAYHAGREGGGFGYGRGRGNDADAAVQAPLARGTLLLDDAIREVVGVVTADAIYGCVGDCDGERPLVSVRACGTPLTLRARRP